MAVPSGPPASTKQIQYLQALLAKAGYNGFRDARHPLGLTQRQAGGKFTISEASALIDRLLAGDGDGSDGEQQTPSADPAAERLDDQRAQIARGLPADVLVAELERRGWTVSPPR